MTFAAVVYCLPKDRVPYGLRICRSIVRLCMLAVVHRFSSGGGVLPPVWDSYRFVTVEDARPKGIPCDSPVTLAPSPSRLSLPRFQVAAVLRYSFNPQGFLLLFQPKVLSRE